MIKEIVDYLNGESRDFDSGFALFCRYTKNRNLVHYIGRKRDMAKLLYELQKLAKQAIPEKLCPPNKATVVTVAAAQEDSSTEGSASISVIRTYDERRTYRGDLPEHLQKVYDENAELYKLRRAWHEKMKFARTDVDRAKCRERLLDVHSQITRRWKKIDDWILSKEQQLVESDFKESSCRAYLSKQLKKESLSPEQLEKMRIRVNAMLKYGCIFSPATEVALKKLNLLQ